MLNRLDPAMLGSSGYERLERDWYPTPPDTSATILPYLSEIGAGKPFKLWEPAAGDGAMLDVLAQAGHTVTGTDIHPMRDNISEEDFLWSLVPPTPCDGIITNPPYGDLAQDFAEKIVSFIDRGEVKFGAILVRNEYDSASGKKHLFSDCPHFAAKIILTFRPRWIAGSKGSPRHNYCWLVWRRDWQKTGRAEVRYAHRKG
jgi:hypothetical protein